MHLYERSDTMLYTLSDLDWCTLCGKYDTVQTYIPINSKNTNWIHVCEKCASMGEDEVRKKFLKKNTRG